MLSSPEVSTDSSAAAIYLQHKGELSLREIVYLILEGDSVCVNGLLRTIQDTTAAKGMSLHVQVVKELAGKCIIMEGLLSHRNFKQKDELLQAFADLAHYAGTGIYPRLH